MSTVRPLILPVLTLLMALSATAMAADGVTGTAKAKDAKASPNPKIAEGLMKKSDCFACHSVKNKVVGPAYRDVAKKYKGNKDAVATLVKKVKAGGSGNWGEVPMAAHPDLKDEDVKAMVQWVLSQK